jgi:ubiquinol-cytochrome c reductase cytochrome b subunit
VARNWREWIGDRFALQPIREKLLARRVPKVPWYYGDGAALLMLLGVQVLTGVTLTLTYAPTPDAAYQSILYITNEQPLGRFLRGLHYWSAGFMVVMVLVHLFRQILLGGYKFPREGTWLVGVILLFFVMTMAFTGYVLRWDERAVYAATVALNMFQYVPLIGEDLVLFVQGGRELGATTLTRFYSVHAIIVPLLMLMLVGIHLYLVIAKGVTVPAETEQPIHTVEQQRALYHEKAESEEEGERFYPGTATHSARLPLGIFAVVAVLAATVGPGRLYPEANLIEPSFPAEEWWFWWYSGLIALVPEVIAPIVIVLLPIVIFAVLFALPFVDRGPHRGVRKRPVAAVAVIAAVAALLILSEYRYRSPFVGWPIDQLPPVPEGVDLSPGAEQGRMLFNTYGCNSCHPVAGRGVQVGPDLARITERRSRAEMKAFILEPPDGAVMPSYAGRLTDDEIERILDFIHVAQTFPREP